MRGLALAVIEPILRAELVHIDEGGQRWQPREVLGVKR
jgi:hypothetical protein